MPRWTPDGERNAFHIQRLKDKLGNRSNASSEVEFRGAWARMVGEEGRGVPTIIEMVNHTRLDCVIGAATGYARRGRAGAQPRRPPLRLRRGADRAAADAERARRPLRRVRGGDGLGDAPGPRLRRGRPPATRRPPSSGASPTPCSSTGSASARPAHAVECLECLGGNGYVEESGMPRLYREAPLDSIWEGSGNVQCLDVLRGDGQEPGLGRGLLRRGARGRRRRAEARRLRRRPARRDPRRHRDDPVPRPPHRRADGPRPASLAPVRYGDPAVADAFCASRLSGDWGHAFGTLPAGTDFGRIIERHSPALAGRSPADAGVRVRGRASCTSPRRRSADRATVSGTS